MKIRMRFNRRFLATSVVAMCLMSSTAWALSVTLNYNFPGVDSGGNLSSSLGAVGEIKANINTRNGRFTARGDAKVQNLSGKKQVYENVPVNVPEATVTSSRYTVKKNGNADVIARGTVNP